ncbi:hypothetical protein C922_05492 [Plasmodium inui San Antonio 1]|uniref:Uncharacterized protein n=1 Tax=Plasmodium inui San Antonio 1 TaxID=1237626 RepID=W6ZXV0_9APIC|nr:hypothetical protein C922_05492 [Plasmodium inui San Antonio 1]EUD64133.1 hypothetical protein C922_05492 [Plasmodium inui San Antonio 1]
MIEGATKKAGGNTQETWTRNARISHQSQSTGIMAVRRISYDIMTCHTKTDERAIHEPERGQLRMNQAGLILRIQDL